MHDRLAVHELLHRWWFVYDEGHFDVWEDMFTEDEVALSSYIVVTATTDGLPSNLASGVVRAVARRGEGVYRLAEVHVVLDSMKAVTLAEHRSG